MRVSMIGLGSMGSGIAQNLIKAGFEVTVWNRSKGPAEALAERGAHPAQSLSEALQSEAVVSMLANDAAVEEVFLSGGVLEAAKKGLLHVNCATISVALAADLAKRHAALGQAYVASPVLGRPTAAAAGALVALLAGAPDAVARAAPLIEAFSRRRFAFGEVPERANVVKLAVNLALAVMIETLGETASLAHAYGVPPEKLYEVMTGTLFAAPAYQTYAKLIGEKQFEPAGFKLPLGLKDVRLALAAGEAENLPLPLGSAVRDCFLESLAAGDEDKDWSALAAGAFRRGGRSLP